MSIINVGCDLNYEVRCTTNFRFQITAAKTPHQKILSESLTFQPSLTPDVCQPGVEGNSLHRITAEQGELTVAYRATVQLSPDVDHPSMLGEWSSEKLPAEVLTFLNPSRYCESDLLGRFAFEEFGEMQPGFCRVRAICDWVTNHLEYTSGSTTSTTTAADVLLQRTGVCRDYAHLAISLCRGIGIPARYVAGYAVDLQPPDFHGFMEAYLDGQWYLFDPTKLAPVSGLVRIGVGRDAADVSFSTVTGNASLTQKSVWANGEQVSDPSTAISTA